MVDRECRSTVACREDKRNLSILSPNGDDKLMVMHKVSADIRLRTDRQHPIIKWTMQMRLESVSFSNPS